MKPGMPCNDQWLSVHLKVFCSGTDTRVGISGTTAKSRQRKFVPSSHPRPFPLVASSHKSQTKVGTLACFDVLVKE